MKVLVERPTEEKIAALQARNWPIWECGVSEFDWSYDERETCLILEGEVEVETPRESVRFGAGDLVVIPAGTLLPLEGQASGAEALPFRLNHLSYLNSQGLAAR